MNTRPVFDYAKQWRVQRAFELARHMDDLSHAQYVAFTEIEQHQCDLVRELENMGALYEIIYECYARSDKPYDCADMLRDYCIAAVWYMLLRENREHEVLDLD